MLKRMRENKNMPRGRARNRRGGFSMVELITIIGVLAILLVIFVPSLLQYTEKSRAQKDDSAMEEVVNAVLLAMADQRVFDDVVAKTNDHNVSCYIDSPFESSYEKVVTKLGLGNGVDQYTFDSNARTADEIPYYAAGNMRGVTLTFQPLSDGKTSHYDVKDAVINQFTDAVDLKVLDKDCAYLYGAVRQTVGDQINIESATYRYSEYTIFIRLGNTTGLNQSALAVYGQFSGTNLTEGDVLYYTTKDREVGDGGSNNEGGGNSNPAGPGVDPSLLTGGGIFVTSEEGVPAGGQYYVGVTGNNLGDYSTATETYSIGDALPTISNGDVFVFGDYEYRYNCYYKDLNNGWVFDANQGGWGARALSTTKIQYKAIVSSINGKPVNTLRCTFLLCEDMLTSPTIPSTVTNMRSTFNRCYSLYRAPIIPEGVTDMLATFRYCEKLAVASAIPSGVVNMQRTFEGCESLTGTIMISANPRTSIWECFKDTKKEIYLAGSSRSLVELAATDGYEDLSANDNVRVVANNPGSTGDLIPQGAAYYVEVGASATGSYGSAKEVVVAGNPFPEETKPGDVYIYGDYEYRYQYYFNSDQNKWLASGSTPIGGW